MSGTLVEFPPRARFLRLSNLNLRSEQINTLTEQAVILEKIFFYNDVFSLDLNRIPNIKFFNESQENLEALWPKADGSAEKSVEGVAEMKSRLRCAYSAYRSETGESVIKLAILFVALFIVLLPFLVNYFEP